MPIVTKITTQKQKGRYNLYLDEQFYCGISENVLVNFQLAKGMELDEATLTALKEADQKSQAYQLALNYLSYQLRTERQMRQYLKEHEINQATIEDNIAQLKTLGYLDDQAYANSFVRTMMNTDLKGPKVIAQKLKANGVSDSQIEQALLQFTPEAKQAIGLKLAKKLAKRYQREAFKTQQQKIYQGLMTKGFNSNEIKAILISLDLQPDPLQEMTTLKVQADKKWRQFERYEPAKRRLKTQQALYRKGFNLDEINAYINDYLLSDEA